GELSRSHLRVVLSRVSPETEALWLERARRLTVRQLEALAVEERSREAAATSQPGCEAPPPGGVLSGDPPSPGVAGGYMEEEPGPRVGCVMAPPAVALMVDEAVEVARKVAGYQVRAGQAVEMMAIETMSGLPGSADSGRGKVPVEQGPEPTREPARPFAAGAFGSPGEASHASEARGSVLGDHESLRRELGRHWARIHEQMEEVTSLWSDLPWDLPGVVFDGVPSEAAGAHARVRFWSAVRSRLDAVRGRLLRVMEDFVYFARRSGSRVWASTRASGWG
ncbi:MAG: hypothetical protein L0214_15390, partial [candidate division NC10 bacterium]|nr:hypothetical protein [candidate division NC10 bacterium]